MARGTPRRREGAAAGRRHGGGEALRSEASQEEGVVLRLACLRTFVFNQLLSFLALHYYQSIERHS